MHFSAWLSAAGINKSKPTNGKEAANKNSAQSCPTAVNQPSHRSTQ
jgi:hypothetical protein